MTPYSEVYSAFLTKIMDDEWSDWGLDAVEKDLLSILESALPWFKFPKHSLERTEEGFVDKLSSQEIQIISSYMKCEWLNRSILTWENIKPLYVERDFSQANLLDKLTKTLESERKNAHKLESIYYRSRDNKPFDYTRLAGGR